MLYKNRDYALRLISPKVLFGGILFMTGTGALTPGGATEQSTRHPSASTQSSCISCHVDAEKLSTAAGELLKAQDDKGAWVGKVLVSREFLETTHGEASCETCHGGDPSATDMEAAHKNLNPFPSSQNPEKTCGDCHDDILAGAKHSIHMAVSSWTGCGDCHISRPRLVRGGLLNGHLFEGQPDSVNQCGACHRNWVGNDYFGRTGPGDVHALKAGMDCVSCHGGEELHATAPKGLEVPYGLKRNHLEEASHCTDCHRDDDLKAGNVPEHAIHIERLQCHVCHSEIRADSRGLPVKVGLNYDKDATGVDYAYMLVRPMPVKRRNSPNIPTWTQTSPHNIRLKTRQTASCNHCHGNRDLFLSKRDVYATWANRKVVVPDDKVPEPVAKTEN